MTVPAAASAVEVIDAAAAAAEVFEGKSAAVGESVLDVDSMYIARLSCVIMAGSAAVTAGAAEATSRALAASKCSAALATA